MSFKRNKTASQNALDALYQEDVRMTNLRIDKKLYQDANELSVKWKNEKAKQMQATIQEKDKQ